MRAFSDNRVSCEVAAEPVARQRVTCRQFRIFTKTLRHRRLRSSVLRFLWEHLSRIVMPKFSPFPTVLTDIAGQEIAQLAGRFGTPVYVYDAA